LPLVLAIEPDPRQAAILKRIVRERVHADFVLVDSRESAVSAMATRIPDVILVTALLSPRDEDELVKHLRGLGAAEHLQTYTIPQLASTAADVEQKNGGGLFGKLLKKKDVDQTIAGCDPDHFAQEILTFLERASEHKSEWAASAQSRAAQQEFKARTESPAASVAQAGASQPAAAEETPAEGADSAWSSPFEWRPASERPAPSSSMVTNVPLAVVAENQETQAEQERESELARLAAEADERARQEAEAQARQDEEEQQRAEEERRKRSEADAAARRKREEEERKRLEAEAGRKKREEEERRKREEEERKRRDADAAARRKREEEERKRLEAEAAARKKREEEERKRLEAEAVARRKREDEERRRREEDERKRLEAEAAARK
jgi:hypothetical protein